VIIPDNARYSNRNELKGGHMKHLRLSDIRTLIAECGDAANTLMQYYLMKYDAKNFTYTDDKAARTLGWSERKVRDNRVKLTKAGWFYWKISKDSNGIGTQAVYLGKDKVSEMTAATKDRKAVLAANRARHTQRIISDTYDFNEDEYIEFQIIYSDKIDGMNAKEVKDKHKQTVKDAAAVIIERREVTNQQA